MTSAHDLSLLRILAKEQRKQCSLYSPGAYWEAKTLSSYRAILHDGISEFRGSHSHVCTSYGDNLPVDRRNAMRYSSTFKRLYYKLACLIPGVSNFMDGQASLTQQYLANYLAARSLYACASPRVRRLISGLPRGISTTSFGCQDSIEVGGVSFSCLYLEMLARIEVFSQMCDLSQVSTFLEIGGGFGAFAHLILEMFPNIKTYYYFDIAPNLFVATKYLQSFYGNEVIDFLAYKPGVEVAESAGRRIFCLPPWLLQHLPSGSIDVFHNASSFVEMPRLSVQNYASILSRLLSANGQVLLESYDDYDLSTTFDPRCLPGFFPKLSFTEFRQRKIFELNGQGLSFFYVSSRPASS